MLTNQSRAYLYGLAAVLCWSTVAVAFKLALQTLTPAQLLLLADLTTVVFLGLFLAIQGQWSQLRQLDKKTWRDSLLFGAMNPFLYYLILFKAYDLLPAQEAQVINFTWALTMSLLAVPLLKHKLSRQDIMAALLCYTGVVLIALRGNLSHLQFSNSLGVGLALVSTVIWALYWILNTRDQRPPVLGLFLNFVCSLPLIIVYCLVTGQLHTLPWQGIPAAVYVGLFEMGVAFVLWLSAMKYTQSTAKISNLIFLAPLLSLTFIYLFLGEPILPSTLGGLALIMLGLAIQQWRSKPAVAA